MVNECKEVAHKKIVGALIIKFIRRDFRTPHFVECAQIEYEEDDAAQTKPQND